MEPLKRREFSALSLGMAAALGADEPRYSFPTAPRERLAVSTYPFRHLMAAPNALDNKPGNGMDLEQFAQTIIPKLNVPGIEPWSHHFTSTDSEYVAGLHDAFQRAGVHVVNIPVDVRVHLCGSSQDRETGLATYRKWLDAAVTLRSPSIRVHLPRADKGYEIDCAVSSLKELADYGASKNIVINIENDNPDTEQPERIVQVLNTVNSPFLRALPDFCNSMAIHDDQSYNNRAMSMLFPLAFNISHVKDSEKDANKTYRVDVDKIFSIARKAGYKGYFSMEWEGTGDAYGETKKLIEASLRNRG